MNEKWIMALYVTIDLLGICLLSVGCYLHYEPLGFMVGGALLWFEANKNVFRRNNTQGTS